LYEFKDLHVRERKQQSPLIAGLFLSESSFRESSKESSSFCLHNNDNMRMVVDVQMKIDTIQTIEFIDNFRFNDFLSSESLDRLSQKPFVMVVSPYDISIEDIVIFRLLKLFFEVIVRLGEIIDLSTKSHSFFFSFLLSELGLFQISINLFVLFFPLLCDFPMLSLLIFFIFIILLGQACKLNINL
jgi:hypothetical protein